MGLTRRGTLLLVEDEHLLRGLVAQFLRHEGFQVVEAGDGAEGVERFGDSGPFDLALVDLNLPDFSGVEVCRRIKRARPDQRLMICSAAILRDHENALAALGVDHYLDQAVSPRGPRRPHRPGDRPLSGGAGRRAGALGPGMDTAFAW